MTSRTTQPSAGMIAAAFVLTVVASVTFVRVMRQKQPAAAAHLAASGAVQDPRAVEPARFRIPVTDTQPSKGPADALVTIVEWNDLRCASCASTDATLDTLLQQYGNKLRLVWRTFPNGQRSDSELAGEFAMEALQQGGKFWRARKLLLEHPEPLGLDDFVKLSGGLEMSATAVKAVLTDHAHAAHLTADSVFAKSFEVQEAPAFFVNGARMQAPYDLGHFKAVIDAESARAQKLLASGVAATEVYAELTKNGQYHPPEPSTLAPGH